MVTSQVLYCITRGITILKKKKKKKKYHHFA